MIKKILLIVANNGFQATEYNGTKNVLIEAGFDVVTASDKPEGLSETPFVATAHDGSTVNVDLGLEEVFAGDYAGIFIIGGPGAIEHLDNYLTYAIVQDADKIEDIVFGAICIAPRILANAGVLRGRKVTGWDNDKELQHVLDEAEALYIKTHVVVDRNLITATGPSATKDFAEAIVTAIKNQY